MKFKKSQGLPVNTLVIAAIALVALIVIIVIFTKVLGGTAENIGSCETKGGKCAYYLPTNDCNDDYPIPLLVSGDCERYEPKNLCCLKAEW